MFMSHPTNTFPRDFYRKTVLAGIHTHIFHLALDRETVSVSEFELKCDFYHHHVHFILGIGQKFAILEEKSIISAVLRNYTIESVDRREDLTLLGELILRPKDGLAVRIAPRM